MHVPLTRCFPDSSVGKESTCNAGDPGWIPGLGRFPGEGIGYLLQYSGASPVAQLVKNLPAMLKTWVWSLVWEDPLEKGMVTHSSKNLLENFMDGVVHGVAKSCTRMKDFHFTSHQVQIKQEVMSVLGCYEVHCYVFTVNGWNGSLSGRVTFWFHITFY